MDKYKSKYYVIQLNIYFIKHICTHTHTLQPKTSVLHDVSTVMHLIHQVDQSGSYFTGTLLRQVLNINEFVKEPFDEKDNTDLAEIHEANVQFLRCFHDGSCFF